MMLHVALFNGVQHRRQQPHVVSKHPRIVPRWLAVGKLVVWVCLVFVIEVAIGQALQFATEHTISRADANEQASPMDTLYAAGTCAALDQYVHHDLTIDELHDLQDELCPTLSEPQRTGN
jgi:hypothetical protein